MIMKPIEERHLRQALHTYNHYVLNTTISFHTEALSLEEMRANVMGGDPRYRTYIIEEEGAYVGYALLTRHKNKQAYDTTAEITIYLDPNHRGKGTGSRAVASLEEKAAGLGFHMLVATVCTENERSIALFERLGYEKCAHFRQVGRKFGRWLDIASYQKIVGSSVSSQPKRQ
ncbi:GNAT family N-acetyltransferase [Paenibacillus humicus]|uniref:GNAT family N-acetyltransferase n=1 Tax=Paenibacillus humicus TaxID=412861 RepID=UPI000FD89920|nr:GNAT family N-acetyltransferase [Paenibacillus humicus]